MINYINGIDPRLPALASGATSSARARVGVLVPGNTMDEGDVELQQNNQIEISKEGAGADVSQGPGINTLNQQAQLEA